jgi:chitin synthase
MTTPYYRPPSADDESDDEGNPFNPGLDPNASTDRIPLTQAIPGQRTNLPPYAASPPVPSGDRPPSRYTLSESYVPAQGSAPTLGGGFGGTSYGPGRVHFPDPGGRPVSVMSNMTEDWIQRQQPVPSAQADLRRYQTRRVKLTQGNVFSADYP